ncbi:MAG TPA: NYN domain-containing protein [Thermoanaerobaculia bacterium]|nr:NYN domain-containing protein [Thermoanaerobaculia bacterium]
MLPIEPEPSDRLTDAVAPEWHVEPTSPPPAPVFSESATELPIAQALPAEEPRFDDEAFDDEDGADEPEEAEASDAERDEKEGESKAEAARRRRSRGRRGGKKRNGGRAAAAPAEEEEEEVRDEPVHETPAPRRIAPAPAPQYRVARGSDSYVISPSEVEPMTREIIISVPERQRSASDERKIALFCDFENIALGVRDSDIGKFEINLVLERLLEKGKIIVKKAYADWERYSDYKRPFHEAAIELIDIPQKFYSGKNSADIKMVVDAMDLSYAKEHLDTFVILSGDSDFSPLVSKLKENNKYVIGIGVKNSSSNLLVDNCDEFIYYEDVWRDAQTGPKLDGLNKKTAEAFSLMIESIQALIRENKDVLWGSMIKQTMQRKKPSFNEGYYGYSTFSELLEDAERKNIIKLKKDQRSGTYIVTGFAKSGDGATAAGRR